MVGKARGGPWFGDERALVIFERGCRSAYPDFKRSRQIQSEGLSYNGVTLVTGYESRRVRLLFPKGFTPESVRISVDGPIDSPHRYAGNTLCIWYPRDNPERKWVHDDGLITLLDLVSLHLFKEAYWRETDRWLGDEVPHAEQDPIVKSRDAQELRMRT